MNDVVRKLSTAGHNQIAPRPGKRRDAGRIIVGGPRDQSGSEQPQENIRTFIRLFC